MNTKKELDDGYLVAGLKAIYVFALLLIAFYMFGGNPTVTQYKDGHSFTGSMFTVYVPSNYIFNNQPDFTMNYFNLMQLANG